MTGKTSAWKQITHPTNLQRVREKIFKALMLFFSVSSCHFALAGESGDTSYKALEEILMLNESEIDLGIAILEIERLVYPNINPDRSLAEIEKIVSKLKKMPDFGPSQLERMGTILRFVYTPSMWNKMQPYHYDFDDPYGRKRHVPSLSYLIENKFGNCVSMPAFITILGQKLGVKVNLAVAPGHVFAIFEDENGTRTNIEATSGTLPNTSRYIQRLNIHPKALTNDIYLTPLTKKESIALFLVQLGRKYMNDGDFESAHNVTDLALKYHPKLVRAMVLKGTIYYQQLEERLLVIKSSGRRMKLEEKEALNYFSQRNLSWFESAEALGWREPDSDFEERYLENIKELRNK